MTGAGAAVLSGRFVKELAKTQTQTSATPFVLAPNCGTGCSLQ